MSLKITDRCDVTKYYITDTLLCFNIHKFNVAPFNFLTVSDNNICFILVYFVFFAGSFQKNIKVYALKTPWNVLLHHVQIVSLFFLIKKENQQTCPS